MLTAILLATVFHKVLTKYLILAPLVGSIWIHYTMKKRVRDNVTT